MTESNKALGQVWLGAETGLLKSVDLTKKVATNHFDKENYGKEHEIQSMCWNGHDKSQLYTGHKNGAVRCFDITNGNILSNYEIPCFECEKDELIAIKCIGDTFLTCTSRGCIKLWKANGDECSTIPAGNNAVCMAYSEHLNHVAVGGKENLLKVWDIKSPSQPIFKAKNVPLNWVQHRIPVWVTNIIFLPDTSRILTTTGTHNLRIYDTKSNKRRPILETEFSEYPLTAAALMEKTGNQVIVGNTRGEMAAFDIRKMKAVLRCYNGFAGSIRSIVCHNDSSHIFSCGLDRYLRVHEEKHAKPIHKVYLKSRLNSVLVTDEQIAPDQANSKTQKRKIDEESEEMWEKMDRISDGNESDLTGSESDSDSGVDENANQIKKNKKK